MAVITLISLLITTGFYLRVLVSLVMGEAPPDMPPVADLSTRELLAVIPLAAFAILIGLLPNYLVSVMAGATQLLARAGG